MKLDKRGRRVGRNLWREYVMDTYYPARQAWELQMEEVAIGYETEEIEFKQLYPGPTLKKTLLGLAGTWCSSPSSL